MLRSIPQAMACVWAVVATTAQGETAVGRVQASFAVSDTGQSTYRIPIKVSPGIAGMEPNIALSYSSGRGSGLAGIGWELSGFSAITRCASTWAQDNAVRGVVFDAGDKFCLDGRKLRVSSGNYGADLSEYRTEIDGFIRVVARDGGAMGAVPTVGPQWFSATTRDGVTVEYGATDDSRIEAQGKTVVRVWAVNKIADAHGNYVEFQYAEDGTNGSYRPSAVHYTGHFSQAPRHSVHFDYEPRPAADVTAEYIFGSLVKETNRLTTIRLDYDGAEVWRYSLAYHPVGASVTRRSLLASVTHCAGADCLPATTFDWTEGETGWDPEQRLRRG